MKKVIVLILALTTACSSTTEKKSIQVGKFYGPEAKQLHKSWYRMAPELGMEPEVLEDLLVEVDQKYVPPSGKGDYGPYTCSGGSCWYGLATWDRTGDYTIRYPRGRRKETMEHELMHLLLDMGVKTGELEHFTQAHPIYVRTDGGQRVNVPSIVRGKWPAYLTGQKELPWADGVVENFEGGSE